MYIPLTLSRCDGNDWGNGDRHHTRGIQALQCIYTYTNIFTYICIYICTYPGHLAAVTGTTGVIARGITQEASKHCNVYTNMYTHIYIYTPDTWPP